MKEKIGIEKLIELLNEFLVQRASGYIHYHSGGEFKRTPTKSAVEGDRMLQDEYVLGKSFGFIKWLVEKNKIDCDKSIFTVDGDYGRDDIIYEIERQNYYILNEQYGVDSTDCILMLLSISSSPIEDLVSYLR